MNQELNEHTSEIVAKKIPIGGIFKILICNIFIILEFLFALISLYSSYRYGWQLKSNKFYSVSFYSASAGFLFASILLVATIKCRKNLKKKYKKMASAQP